MSEHGPESAELQAYMSAEVEPRGNLGGWANLIHGIKGTGNPDHDFPAGGMGSMTPEDAQAIEKNDPNGSRWA